METMQHESSNAQNARKNGVRIQTQELKSGWRSVEHIGCKCGKPFSSKV